MSSYKTVAQEENPSSASPREAEGSRLLDANLESCFKKLLLFPPLLLCNGISLFLITGPVDGWTFKGRQYDWISANRATTQIIVQTLASLLGLTLVATVRSLANFWARNWLTQRPMLLDTVAFFSSMTTSQINWSLRGIRLPALLLTALVALVPAAVWAGAITPILTVLTDETPLSIPTARWTNASG